MRVLVLGSEGQVGQYLVEELRLQGHTVQTFDLSKDPSEDLRIPGNSKLEDAFSNTDYVFFLAFDVGGSKYLAKQQGTFEFFHNNALINVNVFEQLSKWGTRFVYTSSQMSNMAHSPYGFLKMMGEKYCSSLSGQGVVVRFWNVYGFEKDNEKAHVITDFVQMAMKDRVIRMRTDGFEQRQFLYGADCAKALVSVMNNHEALGSAKTESVDITSFEYVSIAEVATKVSSTVAGYIGPVEVIKGVDTDSVQAGQRNEPNKQILEFWAPSVTLEEGIREIIEQYQNGKEG